MIVHTRLAAVASGAAAARAASAPAANHRLRVEEYQTILHGVRRGDRFDRRLSQSSTAVIRRRRRARALQAPLPLIPFSTGFGHVRAAEAGSARCGPPPDHRMRSSRTRRHQRGHPHSAECRTQQNAGRSPYAPPHQAPPVAGRRGERDVGAPTAARWPSTARLTRWSPGPPSMAHRCATGARPMARCNSCPGRLEVIAGRDAGQEIRFVRTPGPDGTR